MDIQSADPKTLDVAFKVKSLSFRYFDEEDAVKLSVRRLTSPHAFDELGRPLPNGLYDPALGPASLRDGPCITCGQSCISCPGHFGHIELPFSVPNPLLMNLHTRLLRVSCAYCYRLRMSSFNIDLLLARLYFEDSGHPVCSLSVEAYRSLLSPKSKRKSLIEPDETMEGASIITNWNQFFARFPEPLVKYMKGIDVRNPELVRLNILRAAEQTWNRARKAGKLLKTRSRGWREVSDLLLSPSVNRCPGCSRKPMKIRKTEQHRIFRAPAEQQETLLSCTELERQIGGLWSQNPELFDLLLGLRGRRKKNANANMPHRHLFVRNVLVPPSRFRPTNFSGDMAAEHPQNLFYQSLLSEIEVIMTADEVGLDDGKKRKIADDDAMEEEAPIKIKPSKTRYAEAMMNIQQTLFSLYDSSSSSASADVQNTGIKQQIEKKSGLFRQHMMGKRVNYSCRSVIGPDVFLDTDEIGIPESFAKLLTVPESVTSRNVESMRRAVLNGPDVYPGAREVEDVANNGEIRVTKLRADDKKTLNAQAGLLLQHRHQKLDGFDNSAAMDLDNIGGNGLSMPTRQVPKRVRRHLKTGDIVLFNRQPTLHRVSIMAHRVRVLPGDRTIRFHYANCGSYNADFDGDEMNVHVPQDYLARVEAEELMLSSKHYIVPTSGAPIRGLIQDHIAASTLLSRRDTFLDRNMFSQLLYSATEKIMMRPDRINQKYVLPMPAIIKPIPLWTGKQLISSLLAIIRNGRPGLFLECGTKTSANVIGKEESQVIIHKGELLQGVIDKSALGSSMYGVVHGVQETYGNRSSDDFLTCMGRLCLQYMRIHGHTTGVSDLELQVSGERKRAGIISEGIQTVGIEVANSVYAELSNEGDNIYQAKTRKQARRLTEEMARKYGNEAEDRLDSSMKAALSSVSSAVMKACIPSSLRRSFPENGFALMTNTGAKGGAVNASQISCLLGSTVLEGKRVPRMGGSGATLPCFAPYDPSPLAGGFIASRFLTGISPQEFFFHAMSGREGLLDTSLKTANSGYLQRCIVKHLEGARVHYDGSVRESDGSVLQFIYGDDGIDPCKSRWLTDKVEWQVKNKKCLRVPKYIKDAEIETIRQRRKDAEEGSESTTLLEEISPSPLSRCGAISEKFDSLIESVRSEDSKHEIRQFLESRYQSAAVEPGEAVGVIAAQGVGEPSTQMTLNTFHHAGSSSAHVTLGIPRLRELLMTAANYPKTPSMTLPIISGQAKTSCEKLRQRLQRIELIDLITNLEVSERSLQFKSDIPRLGALREVSVSLHFPVEEFYSNEIGMNFEELLQFVKSRYRSVLNNLVLNEMKKLLRDGGSRLSKAAFDFYIKETKTKVKEGKKSKHMFEDEADELEEETEAEGKGNESEDTTSEYSDDDLTDTEQIDKNNNGDDDIQEISDDDDGIQAKKKNTNKTKKRRRSEAYENGSSEVKLLDKMEGTNLILLGCVLSSIRGEDKTKITFDWILPFEVCGKMDVAAIAKEAAKCCLFEVHKITQCFEERSDSNYKVITEGSNLPEIFELGHDLIDFNKLETNDMVGILKTYGVEAMRAALIAEFVKVFEAYGIPVSIRHLQLLADYMTVHGGYRAFNRRSFKDYISPFQRMTFETSVHFLQDDALNGAVDEMKNPSAALAIAAAPEGGSGSFELLHQVN